MDRDRNLLFGVLAVQLKQITPSQLVDAAGAWATDPTRDLSERLVELGALSETDRRFIDDIVERAVQQHGGDPSKTLTALGGEEQVHQSFRGSIVITESGGVSSIAEHKVLGEHTDPESVPAVQESPGRYTHISEYGRGGMGRVLLVQDQHLGRDVALKELLPLPGTETDEPTPVRLSVPHMARFLQEARITGQLEHPSVVPVYELGHRKDGTLYYTMKLVRGKTLAEAIRECDSLRERLKLLPHFVDVCQAIAYAHSRGVIHRDIKPSNVMVGEFGETVVIDWGLAKARGKEDVHAQGMEETLHMMSIGQEAEAAKTAYGRAFGTPAYMPPEQSAGLLDEIDERSDVYSLGAVLYEILTQKSPFEVTTLAEILKKVIDEEPRSIDSIEPDTPPELVAICNRAMAKNPEKRYQTSRELAKEVQRFQSGAFVRAYEYGAAEYLGRLLKRYKGIVSTAVAALLLVVVLAGYSYWQVSRERSEAIGARNIAQRHQEEAQRQRDLAQTQKTMALDAIKKLTYDIPDRLADYPETRPVLREFLEENVAMLDRILELEPDSVQVQEEKVANYVRIGLRWIRLGNTSRSVEAYRQALAITQSLVERSPQDRRLQGNLAARYHDVGVAYGKAGAYEEALDAYRNSIEIKEGLLSAYGDNATVKQELAMSYNNVAEIHRSRAQYDAAWETREKSREILEGLLAAEPDSRVLKQELAMTYKNLGLIHRGRLQYDAALEAYWKSREMQETLLAAEPDDTILRHSLASTCNDLGLVHRRRGQYDAAVEAHGKSREILEALLASDRDNATVKQELARTYNKLGNVYSNCGQLDAALEAQEKGLEIYEALLKDDPGNATLKRDVARSFLGTGVAYTAVENQSCAITHLEGGFTLYEEWMRNDPFSPVPHKDMQYVYGLLIALYGQQGQVAESLALQERYLRVCQVLVDAHPGDRNGRMDLARGYTEAGEAFNRQEVPGKARAMYKKGLAIFKELAEEDPGDGALPNEIERLEQRLRELGIPGQSTD